jgi:hypothetical protein
MLTKPRWEAEVRIMKNNFPHFEPFAIPGQVAGFRGGLRGRRTGRVYHVTIQVAIAMYPSQEPAVYMTPRPEPHHWIKDGRLCYQRDGHGWNPAEDTIAQALVIAANYIAEFDGRG